MLGFRDWFLTEERAEARSFANQINDRGEAAFILRFYRRNPEFRLEDLKLIAFGKVRCILARGKVIAQETLFHENLVRNSGVPRSQIEAFGFLSIHPRSFKPTVIASSDQNRHFKVPEPRRHFHVNRPLSPGELVMLPPMRHGDYDDWRDRYMDS